MVFEAHGIMCEVKDKIKLLSIRDISTDTLITALGFRSGERVAQILPEIYDWSICIGALSQVTVLVSRLLILPRLPNVAQRCDGRNQIGPDGDA